MKSFIFKINESIIMLFGYIIILSIRLDLDGENDFRKHSPSFVPTLTVYPYLFNRFIPAGYKPSTKSVGRTASDIGTRKESHRTRRRTTTQTVREVSRRRGQTGGQSGLVSKGTQIIFHHYVAS